MIKAKKTDDRRRMIVRKFVVNLAIAGVLTLITLKIAPLIYVAIRLTIGTVVSQWVSK